jgi:DNA-binding HxlR family transcriptional regulator
VSGAQSAAAQSVAPDPERTPALHVITGGADGQSASASDREMIEATAAAVELFAAKWKVDLLYLLAAGVRRHCRLHDHLIVSKKVLSEALRALERDGLVHRQVFAERPIRVEYTLTPLGRSLTGPLFALYEWAEQRFDEVLAARNEHDQGHGREPDPAEGLPRFKAAFQVRSHQQDEVYS